MAARKILFLCHSLAVGGLEIHLLRFLEYVRTRDPDAEFHVLCKSGESGPLHHDFVSTGATLWLLRQANLDLPGWRAFWRLVRSQRFDVVCDFGGSFSAPTLILAWLAGVEHRVTFFRNQGAAGAEGWARACYRHLANAAIWCIATRVLSNSKTALVQAFGPLWQRHPRFKVLRNGVPWTGASLTEGKKTALREELGLRPDERVILHVGRYRWEKNHETILAVAEQLQQGSIPVRVVLVGGDVEEGVAAQIHAHQLGNVIVAGERRDVRSLLAIADAFYFPSLAEGQPNALVEAVLAGVQFVASDISAIRECLPEWWGARGLVAPRDAGAACRLLVEQLVHGRRQDPDFERLVQWMRVEYDPPRNFDAFLVELLPSGAAVRPAPSQ